MIGSLDPSKKDIQIIGGGIAGLLTAYVLSEELCGQGYEITLTETKSRVGGFIQTEMTPWGIAESAAHSLLVTDSVKKLCEELHVELTGVCKVTSNSGARYILRNGHMRRFPLSACETVEAFLRATFVRSDSRTTSAEMTVKEWGDHFLGKAVSHYLLGPITQGIYGTRAEEVLVHASFPFLAVPSGRSFLEHQLLSKLENWKYGRSRQRKTKPVVMVPREGMESLTRALEERLRKKLGIRFQTGRAVTVLPEAGNLILAVPAFESAKLVADRDPELSQALKRIHYTSLLCVTVFVKRKKLRKEPKGMGLLVAAGEKSRCLGILFNSSSFEGRVLEPKEMISFSVFLGGSRDPQILDWSDESVIDLVNAELASLLGLQGKIEGCVIRRQKNAIPCYDKNLMKAIEMAKKGWCSRSGRILFGNYTGQVSIRGMIERLEKFRREMRV